MSHGGGGLGVLEWPLLPGPTAVNVQHPSLSSPCIQKRPPRGCSGEEGPGAIPGSACPASLPRPFLWSCPTLFLKSGAGCTLHGVPCRETLSFLSSSSAPSKAPSPYWLLRDGHHAATGLCARHPETRRGSSRSEERTHRCMNTFSLPYGEGEPDLRTVPIWRNHTLALRDSKASEPVAGAPRGPGLLG